MRKYLSIPLLAFAVCASATVSAPLTGKWSSSDPVAVRAPFMNDSVSPQGDTFKFSSLLSSGLRHKIGEGTMLVPDTAGVIALSVPGSDGTLRVLQTRMRSSRFAKGTLKVTSPLALK